MSYIIGQNRNQINIIPFSLDEIIDADNSVRAIDAYVNSLDLKELGFIEYTGTNRGQAPYLRTDLLKLHIYGYLNKIRSSRNLEVEAKRNIELMWLINSITPDHGTIAGFVQKNKNAFRKILRHLTLLLKGWGLIDGKLVAIDGTKIRAQNSKHNCITKSSLEKKIEYADEQIQAYLAAMEKSEGETDDLKEKVEAYQQLKEKYELQKKELKESGVEQKSLTDSDSRRMKNNGSLDICYNVQSVVDSKNHFVIDAVATNDINDQNQLSTMAFGAKELLTTGEMSVVADTGYYNAVEIKKCYDKQLNLYIKKAKANNKTKENEFRKDKFVYDEEKDVYICPANCELLFFENTSKNGLKYRKYKGSDCQNCSKRKQCTTSSTGRCVQRWEHENVLEIVKQDTFMHNDIYKQRRSIVEHPFGTIKRTLGYNHFMRKKIENVNAETASMFIAYNFKRLLSMFSVKELIGKLETG